MINYAPLPRSRYCAVVNGISVGPGRAPVSEAEWNLLAVCTRVLFSWEDKRIPAGSRSDFISDVIQAVAVTVNQTVGGESVRSLIERMNPVEFVELFKTSSIDHLDIVQLLGGSELLLMIMKIRVLVWFAARRKVNGKIISFSPNQLSEEEEMWVDGLNPWKNGEIFKVG